MTSDIVRRSGGTGRLLSGGTGRLHKQRMPLYEKLLAHQARHTASFHVPGHKYGGALEHEAEALHAMMAFDFTELTGLDDLHQPQGVIREAEQLAAECFGADRTFFLVQGSTLGNLAMIMSVCGEGDLVLVDRFCHKSVLNALMLAGARAVFLPPLWDPQSGYAAGVEPDALRHAVETYPEAKAVFVTRPNYFGRAWDLNDVIRIAHEADIPVLVDEAHGAHFGFHPDVPESALKLGADAVVQSTHKMLSAMTMGAMLHIQGERISAERVADTLRMLQTSSPSYPIMASLDLARRLMHTDGEMWIAKGLEAVNSFNEAMQDMPSFECSSHASSAREHSITQDPFKIAVRDRTGTLDGYALQAELERNGCMIEMADPNRVLLVFSPFSSKAESLKLAQIFRRIQTQYMLDKKELLPPFANIYTLPSLPSSPEPVRFTRGLSTESSEFVRLADAAGRYSAEMIVPYPPGIPFAYPGEQLSQPLVEALQTMASLGARFQGVHDPQLQWIRVTTPDVR